MNKVNSDIEKKSYVGSKQACVCVLWDRERQRKREAEIEKEKETGTHTGRERTFVRLGWEGLCKEGTGTGELGHEQWKGNSYMKIQGKSVSSRTVNEEAMRQFSLMEAQKAACVAGAQWIWDPEKGDEVGEQARQWASPKSSESAGLSSRVPGSHQRVLCKGIVTLLTLWTGHSGFLR